MLAALEPPDFEAALNARAGGVLGTLRLASARRLWPIVTQIAERLDGPRAALVAEADDAIEAAGSPATPAFVRALQDQPRAGATHPTEPRLMLEPPESHADHCWAVAAIAALLAIETRADPGVPLLAALALAPDLEFRPLIQPQELLRRANPPFPSC